jgi:hypothetical protein
MDQAQLNRAVAQATGETVQTIDQLGFRLLRLPQSSKCRPRSRQRRHRCPNHDAGGSGKPLMRHLP